MAKNTEYSTIQNVRIGITFNQVLSIPSPNIQPVVITATGQAITDEGASLSVSVTQNIGSVVQNPLTIQQIYTAVNNATTANTILSGLLKQLLVQAINVDPSA